MSEKTLEARIERLEAIHEVEQVMARRSYYHTAGRHDLELTETWSRNRDDLRLELEDWGLWVGRESVWKAYVESNPFGYPYPGIMSEHTLTTGVIEVAADGQTAKGIWISPGHETIPFDPQPIAHWCWNRYGVDFIKEDGEWRIWHLHIYTTLRTPYDTDWVESSINRPAHFPPEGDGMPGMHPPDEPITFNQPYRIDEARELQPFLPEPYETWSDTYGYTDPEGVKATLGPAART
jgi:hypothetical protein